MKVKKVVIPAAGFGTRFLPASKAVPKEMLPIVDKPTIQYVVEEAINSGIEEILIIIGRNKENIINHFDRSPELEMSLKERGKDQLLEISENVSNMANIHYIRQKTAKGLGHAIAMAKAFVGNEPFGVILGDDIVYSEQPCLKQLMDVYETYDQSVIGVQRVDQSQVDKYGIVDGEMVKERTYKVHDLVEKPPVKKAPSNVAILGRYILSPEIFEILETIEPGKGGEIQLTDGLRELRAKEGLYAYDFEGKRYDAGDKLGYLKATVEYALRTPELKDAFEEYLKELFRK